MAKNSNELLGSLRRHLVEAEPDLLREMLKSLVPDAQADALDEPNVRSGSHCCDWRIERREKQNACWSPSALVKPFDRRVDGLVKTLGIQRLSQSV